MSETIRSYTDLIAWQKCYQLGLSVHAACSRLPESERFALTAMLRRTAISLAPEIAGAYGCGQTFDYVRGLKNARAMLYRIDTMLLMTVDLKYIEKEAYRPLKDMLDEAERVVAGLIKSLER